LQLSGAFFQRVVLLAQGFSIDRHFIIIPIAPRRT
jgi:hypothetical protein